MAKIKDRQKIIFGILSTVWYFSVLWYSQDLVLRGLNFLGTMILVVVLAILLSYVVLILTRNIKNNFLSDIGMLSVPVIWIFIISIFKLPIGLVNYDVWYNLGSGLLIGLPLSMAIYYSFVKGYVRL